jgi:hypothetical protein
MDPRILQSRVSDQGYFSFLNTLSYPLMHVFSRSLIWIVFLHVAVKKCVKGCVTIVLVPGLVAGEKLPLNGLHAHLTLITCTRTAQAAERNYVAEFRNLQVK